MGLSKITLCRWKVSDAAVNIEKCAVKIKTTCKNDKAVVVVNNHRFVFLSNEDYAFS